jgi:hypothetical protein
MVKPQFKDFHFKSIKTLNSGGAYIEFEYYFPVSNDGQTDEFKMKRTLNVHEDMMRLFKSLKPMVLRTEEIDFRLMVTTAEQAGINNLDTLSKIAEGMTVQAMSKIEITGISISGQDEARKCVIKYKKIDGSKKISGRCTTAIQLSASTYGFEEDLIEKVDEIIEETYKYIYENKHSDFEQSELSLFKKEEEVKEQEDNEEDTEEEPE